MVLPFPLNQPVWIVHPVCRGQEMILGTVRITCKLVLVVSTYYINIFHYFYPDYWNDFQNIPFEVKKAVGILRYSIICVTKTPTDYLFS
jgi:hypothetical protein